MSATGSALVIWACVLAAPPGRADLSPLEQQAADFTGAIGVGVRAAWHVSPNPLPLSGDAVLTLTLSNLANAAQVSAPDAAAVAPPGGDFARAFQMLDLPPEPPPSPSVAVFRYRLVPRRAGAFTVPPLAVSYYRPPFPEGRRFLTTYAEPLGLTVTETPTVKRVPVPLDAPEELFAPIETGSPPFPAWPWLAWPVLVPLAGVAYAAWWRWRNPTAARLARLRRPRVVRQTLAALADARTAEDVGLTARGYLAARHGLDPWALTPPEAEALLRGRGWGEALSAAFAELLAACDRANFAPPPGPIAAELATRAEALILASEEDADDRLRKPGLRRWFR